MAKDILSCVEIDAIFTTMTTRSVPKLILLVLLAFVLGAKVSTLLFASSESYSHRVTISVPSYLFIDSDQKNLDLSFSDYKSGAESNAQTVVYTVRGNGLTQSEGAPAVTAKLDGPFPDIDFKAKVGPYTKEGGNAELGAVSADFVTINESDVPLAKKANSLGDGKLLRGQIAMTYKAVATSSLTSGEHSRQLTVTLTDI